MIGIKNKAKLFAAVLVILFLVSAFFCGCSAKRNIVKTDTQESSSAVFIEETADEPADEISKEENKATTPGESISAPQEEKAPLSVQEEKAEETEVIPEEKPTEQNGHRCTLSVRCDSLLNNMSLLSEGKREIVPADGIIFPETTVEFFEGESVFNVLVRELKKKKIHIEFVSTPMYNSSYIEGISNIYEFDCGDNSGWLYKVNGQSPGCGSSQYIIKDNDKIEWIYSVNFSSGA